MFRMQQLAVSAALLVSVSGSASAFFDELVIGATSVTNNLISSTASVTNNTVNTASTTMISLSSNPGKMADRIGVMADRIGYMADRIVTTEGIMAGLAHKIIDSNAQPRPVQQYASTYVPGYAPAQAYQAGYQPAGNSFNPSYNTGNRAAAPVTNSNPYLMTSAAAPAQPVYAQPDNNRYSASHMIYGNSGATYTAARQAPASVANPYQSGFGFSAGQAANTASNTASNSCGLSYGMPRSC